MRRARRVKKRAEAVAPTLFVLVLLASELEVDAQAELHAAR